MIILRVKNVRIGCLVLGLIMLLSTGCNTTTNETDRTANPDGLGQDVDSADGDEDPDDVGDVDGDTADDNPQNGEDEPPVGNLPPEKTQSENDKPFWQTESNRQVSNLVSIASAAQKDYNLNGEKKGWMSKDGKLYSHNYNAYITTEHLVEDGYLEAGLTASDYELLLINGSDLSGYDGMSVPKDSTGYCAFAVSKQSGKYLFASASGKVGTLSAENYQAVLANYNQDHGKIGRLSSGSADYDRILNFVSLYEGQFIDYSVRQIYKDSKYAVVVLSPASNTAKVKQYILKNDNNFWEVVLPNLQTESYPITATNRYLPDFNMDLLPPYNLAAWRGYIVSEQGGAVAALFKEQFISSESQIRYQCGTASCYYFVLTDGTRYACYNDNGIWEATKASTDIDAGKYFKAKTGYDYGFIILDD